MKLAFVTPWYGLDIPGGAEAEVRRTVEKLHQVGVDVVILTTTIKDFYADWGQNTHKPGAYQENGITVHRFPVQKRDKQAFDSVNWRLINNLPITREQEQIYINEMIQVPTLYEYIAQHASERLFVFIPYMFATTYHGAKICPERSLIIPCLHDESYAWLGIYQEVLPQVKGLILHVDAELALTEQIFGPAHGQKRMVIGEGVDTDFVSDGERFRCKYKLDKPFVLYAGRREAGKNVPMLLDYWQRFQQELPQDTKLVLIGPGSVNIPTFVESSVLDLGFVSVQDKYDAYAAADVFCMPSVNESFSIVIMESWLAGTPILVNGNCAVTKEHSQRANGGLYFHNYEEFAATLTYLLDHRETAVTLGQQGRQYVLTHYHWDIIIEKYQKLFQEAFLS
ncbi:MAG: glycosyltransferase family 4 protein [Anaerolineae bacterium]|nr:glycosyltransferase family 4 protein [Anaerolineae bacterium]